MNAFEKYIREKNTINGNELPISVGIYISEKDGWKAALEWVTTEICTTKDEDLPDMLFYLLEKELADE